MLNYRNEPEKMPSYDGVEKNYRIKVNANKSTLNLPKKFSSTKKFPD